MGRGRVRVADGDMCVIDPFRFASLLLLVPSSMVTLFPRFAAGCSHPFFLPSLPPSLLYRQSSSPSVPLPRRVCGPRHRNSEMKFRTDFAYKFHPHPHPSTNRPLNGEQKRESNPRNERERVSTLSPVPRSSSRSLTILSSSISFLRTNGTPFHGERRRSPPYSPNYPLPLIDIA